MNDQLSDSTLKQFFIDLIRMLGVENLWWLSRVALVWAGLADYLATGILVFAQDLWIPALVRSFARTLYAPAIALAIALLILVLFFWGFGVKVRWVRPGGLLRWSVILLCLASIGAPLWAWLEQTTDTVPATLVALTRPPLLDGESVGVITGPGTVYRPLDQRDPQLAALNRAMAPVGDLDRDGAFEAVDLALAIWRATPDEAYRGAVAFRMRTPDGALAIEGLPADFQQTFFPGDPAVPWWSGNFTTDPNGGVKRAQAQKLAEVGLLQSLTGLTAALGVLLQSLTTLLFRLGAALLFATFCALAPLGLFGNTSMWLGGIALAWLALYPLRIMVSCASLLLTVLLFGTVQTPGLGTFYPAVFGATCLYTYLHWRLFKASWGLLRTRVAPVFGGLWQQARGSKTMDQEQTEPGVQRRREEELGFSDITIQGGASAGLRAYHALEQPLDAHAPVSMGQTLHGGLAAFGMKRLVEADMQAAARVTRQGRPSGHAGAGPTVARPLPPPPVSLALPPAAAGHIVPPAQAPVRQLALAPRTEAGTIDAYRLPLLAHAAPAIASLSERYGAEPVVAAARAAEQSLGALEQQGVSYDDLAHQLSEGDVPPAVQAAMETAAPELAASPTAAADGHTIAQLTLGARETLPARHIAASLGATVAAGGDLATLQAASGVDARTLGSGATYVGQYLQWAAAHDVDGMTAEQLAADVLTTGTVARTTARHLAPDVRAAGVALAQALPGVQHWTRPLQARPAAPPAVPTGPGAVEAPAAAPRAAGLSRPHKALIGAGLLAAAVVSEGLLEEALDVPDPVLEPPPVPDVGPAVPLVAGALAWQHRQDQQAGTDEEPAPHASPRGARRTPHEMPVAAIAPSVAPPVPPPPPPVPAATVPLEQPPPTPTAASNVRPDVAASTVPATEDDQVADDQPAPEPVSLRTKLLVGAGVVAAGVLAEGVLDPEWVAEEVPVPTLEPVPGTPLPTPDPPLAAPTPEGTPTPSTDGYTYEELGEPTIRRLNPDGSSTIIQEGTPAPTPAPAAPQPNILDRLKGAMDTSITDQRAGPPDAPGRS